MYSLELKSLTVHYRTLRTSLFLDAMLEERDCVSCQEAARGGHWELKWSFSQCCHHVFKGPLALRLLMLEALWRISALVRGLKRQFCDIVEIANS